MKLTILIFAYNEAETIVDVIREIPRHFPHITEQSIILIDDGSTDDTVNLALSQGIKVVRHKRNKGLARAFMTGIDAALSSGADIIAHIDGDGQFNAHEIEKILEPILNGSSDASIGRRDVLRLPFMPAGKKYGNYIGDLILNSVLGLKNIDTSCGFRAYTRDCAMRFLIFSRHTYTHEAIIQMASSGFHIASVPIECKERKAGKSKLITSIITHVNRSTLVIIRALLYYRPLKIFSLLGSTMIGCGIILGLRYLYFVHLTHMSGHFPSLILASILIILGTLTGILGLLADLIGKNIRLNQELLYEARKKRYAR
jgi:glycosyltransferase involved in cell wall biosynthesis